MWLRHHFRSLRRRRHPRKRGVSDKEQPLSDLFTAPLVLFLPEGDVKALELRQQHLDQWASNIWVQQPNALDEALLSALRCGSWKAVYAKCW